MISNISTNLISLKMNSPYISKIQVPPAVEFSGDSSNLIRMGKNIFYHYQFMKIV